MSSFSGRTGVNFSNYLNNLNTIPAEYENELLVTDDINIDQELAMFTNTDFTDFDNIDAMANNNHLNFELKNDSSPAMDMSSDLKYDELMPDDPTPYMINFGAPIQPAPQPNSFASRSNLAPHGDASSSLQGPSRPLPMKQKQEPPPSVEEETRLAAEEDKRRRNTAASARFRVKKKQREQALEKTVKDVSDKNTSLQAKVEQLEMENKWLKNLVMEKSGSETEKDISELYQKYRRESEEREDPKGSEHTDGVGTK